MLLYVSYILVLPICLCIFSIYPVQQPFCLKPPGTDWLDLCVIDLTCGEMAAKKRKNPFAEVVKEETTEADKPLYEAVFNIGKTMKTTAAIDISIIIKDISIEGVAAIIDDFEHGKAVNKAKIESIVKHTESFKQLQKMEDKIKSSKEKLTSLAYPHS